MQLIDNDARLREVLSGKQPPRNSKAYRREGETLQIQWDRVGLPELGTPMLMHIHLDSEMEVGYGGDVAADSHQDLYFLVHEDAVGWWERMVHMMDAMEKGALTLRELAAWVRMSNLEWCFSNRVEPVTELWR